MDSKEYITEKSKFMGLATSQQFRLVRGSALHKLFCCGYWFAVAVGVVVGGVAVSLVGKLIK